MCTSKCGGERRYSWQRKIYSRPRHTYQLDKYLIRTKRVVGHKFFEIGASQASIVAVDLQRYIDSGLTPHEKKRIKMLLVFGAICDM